MFKLILGAALGAGGLYYYNQHKAVASTTPTVTLASWTSLDDIQITRGLTRVEQINALANKAKAEGRFVAWADAGRFADAVLAEIKAGRYYRNGSHGQLAPGVGGGLKLVEEMN